jgi:hypothetical protein
MQSTESGLGRFIDDAVILGRRLPAHSSDEANGLHVSLLSDGQDIPHLLYTFAIWHF